MGTNGLKFKGAILFWKQDIFAGPCQMLKSFLYRAGVGRTGIFIAIECCLRQMEQDQCVDIFGTVCQMRRQRNFMVFTEVWSRKLSKQWELQFLQR